MDPDSYNQAPKPVKTATNPETGWVEAQRLPAEEKQYSFGTDWLPFMRSTTKVALLVEHQLARKNAGHARTCRIEVVSELDKTVGKQLEPDGTVKADYLAHSLDGNLTAWAERAAKFSEKQKAKKEAWGINLTNVPFKAGPVEIKNTIERILEKEGCVKAIDPWWAKKGWVHDGGVTVFLNEKDATDLLELGKEGIMFSEEYRRKIKITPGSDGRLARILSPIPKSTDLWD